MTNEEKQALIEYCKEVQGNNPESSDAYKVISIALAALTAPPVDWHQRAVAAEKESARLADWVKCVEAERDKNIAWHASQLKRAEAAEAIAADVEEILSLLAEREWAEHCTKTDTGKRLEEAITELHDEAAPAVSLTEMVPEGWKLVPVEPTEEMIAAGDQFMDGLSRLGDAYEAMLAAAPEVE